MASGIDVNIGADTREYDQAVRKGMVEPVGDAQQALDDLTRGGESAGASLTRSFEGQQRATTDARKSIDDLNDTIRRKYPAATRTASASSTTFRHDSTEAFDEVKDSARSNAIEVGASFTGGFDQAAGGLQGFLAEFLAGFGPGGVIAGVGIAALLGVVTQAISDGTESAEAQQQAIADLASEYIEAGGSGKRSFDGVKASIEAMATSKPGDVILTLQEAWKLSKQAGQDYAGVVQAIASGSPAQIDTARRELARVEAQHLANSRAAAADGKGNAQAAQTGVVATGKLEDKLRDAAHQAREAAKAQRLAAEAGLTQWALKAGEVDQLEQSFDDAAGAIDDYLNKEKDTLDPEKYIKAMHRRQKALADLHGEYAKSNLDPAAIKFLESQGADAAAAALRGYQKASPAQQAELNRIWTTAGTDSASSYKDAIGKDLKATTLGAPKIDQPKVPAPDTSALDRVLQQPHRLRVMLEVYDRKGQRVD